MPASNGGDEVADEALDESFGVTLTTAREFLIYDVAQIYPEYVMYYK